MDAFPPLASKSYQALRNDIRSGDILLCSGHSVFSTLIQQATHSVWSHVAFILRIDAIGRIMVLESVESIGVRTVPLSAYTRNYNGSGKGYPGRLMLARHQDVKAENIANLSRSAIDLLGYPYGTEEIVSIASRISMHSLGMPNQAAEPEPQRDFICSEYAHVCFKSIGITLEHNAMGFIAPADFANHPRIKPLCYLESNAEQAAA